MAITNFVAKKQHQPQTEFALVKFTLTLGAQNDIQSFDGYLAVIEGATAYTESSGALTAAPITITTSNNLKFTGATTGSVRGIAWGYE